MVDTPEGMVTLPVFISVMVATMYSRPCCGLAAPQLGVQRKIIVYNPDLENDPDEKDTDRTIIMINPLITNSSEAMEKDIETCLSLPGIEASVKRHTQVTVTYIDEDLKAHTLTATDWEARIIQHEVDHLDGKLFWDRLGPMKQTYMNKYQLAKKRKKRHGK